MQDHSSDDSSHDKGRELADPKLIKNVTPGIPDFLQDAHDCLPKGTLMLGLDTHSDRFNLYQHKSSPFDWEFDRPVAQELYGTALKKVRTLFDPELNISVRNATEDLEDLFQLSFGGESLFSLLKALRLSLSYKGSLDYVAYPISGTCLIEGI